MFADDVTWIITTDKVRRTAFYNRTLYLITLREVKKQNHYERMEDQRQHEQIFSSTISRRKTHELRIEGQGIDYQETARIQI